MKVELHAAPSARPAGMGGGGGATFFLVLASAPFLSASFSAARAMFFSAAASALRVATSSGDGIVLVGTLAPADCAADTSGAATAALILSMRPVALLLASPPLLVALALLAEMLLLLLLSLLSLQPEQTTPAEPKDSAVPSGATNEAVIEGGAASRLSDDDSMDASMPVDTATTVDTEMERACKHRFQMIRHHMTA